MFIRKSIIVTMCLCFACNSSENPTNPSDNLEDDNPTNPLGSWSVSPSLPTAHGEMPVVVLNGKIYVPGGFDQNFAVTNKMEIFNPESNTWSSTNIPVRFHHFACAASNEKLYILGGYEGNSFFPVNRVYEYDPSTNEWNLKEPIPTVRGAQVAVEVNGKIYVIGGADNMGRTLAINEMYDPQTDSWITRAPMLLAREHLAAAVIDTLIYVVGGRHRASEEGGTGTPLVNTNILESYNPSTNKWQRLKNMPTARGGLAAASLNSRLYVFGGEFFDNGGGVFSETEEYDPVKDIWRQLKPMRTPRHGIGAATIGNKIYVIGGGDAVGFQGAITRINESFTISLDTN